MSKAEGKCLCGKVHYAVCSQPVRVTFCHCKFCQRATGSAYLVEPVFDQPDFNVTRGRPKIYEHRSEGSGKSIYVNFCATCGTKLFMTFERFPDVVGIFGGTFDDPNWFDNTPENSKQIFLRLAQSGTIIPAGINTYEEHATAKDGTVIEPSIFDAPQTIGN